MSLDWKGDELLAKIEKAAKRGVDQTTAAADGGWELSAGAIDGARGGRPAVIRAADRHASALLEKRRRVAAVGLRGCNRSAVRRTPASQAALSRVLGPGIRGSGRCSAPAAEGAT